jgi:hypothetical protein
MTDPKRRGMAVNKNMWLYVFHQLIIEPGLIYSVGFYVLVQPDKKCVFIKETICQAFFARRSIGRTGIGKSCPVGCPESGDRKDYRIIGWIRRPWKIDERVRGTILMISPDRIDLYARIINRGHRLAPGCELIGVWRADVEPAIYKIARDNNQFSSFFHKVTGHGIDHNLIYGGFSKIGRVIVTAGVA